MNSRSLCLSVAAAIVASGLVATPVFAQAKDAKIIPAEKHAGEGQQSAPKVHPGVKRAPFDGPRPNRWFEKSQIDLGTFLEGETAVARFPFKNPDATEHVMKNITPNCQCANAKIFVGDREYVIENHPVPNTIYRLGEADGEAVEVEKAGSNEEDPSIERAEKGEKELVEPHRPRTKVKHIAVGPAEEGFVEMHLNLKGVTGLKEAFITIRTDDPLLPTPRVIARARGVEFFTINPPQINLNKMTWDEQREFSFELSSEVKPDFEIVGITSSNEALKVTSKTKLDRGGKSYWKISGTYGPDTQPRAGGGVMTVETDLREGNHRGKGKSTDVRVIAVVEGPLTVKPGTFLPFGRIRRDEGARKIVEFVPNNEFELQFADVVFENITAGYENFVSIEKSKDGKNLKLELVISPDAPRGLVRGDIVVGLNHPSIPSKSLQFNGFVR